MCDLSVLGSALQHHLLGTVNLNAQITLTELYKIGDRARPSASPNGPM